MKKSYNPFKMWGSWVGLSIPFLFYFFLLGLKNRAIGGEPTFPINIVFFNWRMVAYISPNFFGISTFFIIPLITWFLVGWGIHSLFRRYLK